MTFIGWWSSSVSLPSFPSLPSLLSLPSFPPTFPPTIPPCSPPSYPSTFFPSCNSSTFPSSHLFSTPSPPSFLAIIPPPPFRSTPLSSLLLFLFPLSSFNSSFPPFLPCLLPTLNVWATDNPNSASQNSGNFIKDVLSQFHGCRTSPLCYGGAAVGGGERQEDD